MNLQKNIFEVRLPERRKSRPTRPTCPTRGFWPISKLKINSLKLSKGLGVCWARLGALGGGMVKVGEVGALGGKIRLAVFAHPCFFC